MYRLIVQNSSSTGVAWGGTGTDTVPANEGIVRYFTDTCGVNRTTTNGNMDIVFTGVIADLVTGTGTTTVVSANIATGIRARLQAQVGEGWMTLYDSNYDTDVPEDNLFGL